MNTSEIKKIIDKNPNNIELQAAQKINAKTSFFYEKNITTSKYEKKFLAKAKKLINNRDGYARFLDNFEYPLKTNRILSDISNQMSKIFVAEDRNFGFNGKKINDLSFDFNYYKTEFYETYLRSPNNLLYIQYQNDKTKFSEVDVSQVLAYEKKNKDFFDWIIIDIGGNLLYIDDFVFQIYSYDNQTVGKMISEEQNKLGFVPVFHFSDELFNSQSLFVRGNIFSSSLAEIEEYERLSIFKKIMSPYAFYMFITRYREQNCNYDNGVLHCEGGFLVDNDTGKTAVRIEHGEVVAQKCPVCNQDLGIGNQIAMGKLFNVDSWNVLERPLDFLSPPTDILEYSDNFLDKKKSEIYNSILGIEQSLNDKVAHTAEAYKYNSTSREQSLLNLKEHFEHLISIIENARIAPIAENRTQFYINLGSKFLIGNLNDLMSDLENARSQGLGEILNIRNQIIAKKYENDSLGRFRAEILNTFYPAIPEEELQGLENTNELKKRQLYFHAFISWFETYKRPITDFVDTRKAVMQLEKDFNNFLKIYNL